MRPAATPKKHPQQRPQFAAAKCNVTEEEAVAIYQAAPFCFSTVPTLQESSTIDTKVPRGAIRGRVYQKFEIAAGSTHFFCPSPLASKDGGAFNPATGEGSVQAIGHWVSTNWAGATAPFADVTELVSHHSALQATYTNSPVNFLANPDTAIGSAGMPISLCGGLFCAKVMVPYNGMCNVFQFGPTDSSNVQGIYTGDQWRGVVDALAGIPGKETAPRSAYQNAINPRRQFLTSAYFHSSNTRNTVAAATEPIMLVGSSMSAEHNFGFALVEDMNSTPIYSTQVYNFSLLNSRPCGADYYPAYNPCSGLLNGQGCMYIENTGAVAVSVVVELFVDYCSNVSVDSQTFLSPEVLSYGPEGAMSPPQRGVAYPGLNATDCFDLMHKIALFRIPKHLRTRNVDECLVNLLKNYSATIQNIPVAKFKSIPLDPSPRGAFVKSLAGLIGDARHWISERVGDFKDIGSGIAQVTRAAAMFMA